MRMRSLPADAHSSPPRLRLPHPSVCLSTDAERSLPNSRHGGCPSSCDLTCGCEACPDCERGSRCGFCSGSSGPGACPGCAHGGRPETPAEAAVRRAAQKKATSQHRARHPFWAGPQRMRTDAIVLSSQRGGNVWTWATLSRELHGPAAAVREALQLLDAALACNAPGEPLTALSEASTCALDEAAELLHRAACAEDALSDGNGRVMPRNGVASAFADGVPSVLVIAETAGLSQTVPGGLDFGSGIAAAAAASPKAGTASLLALLVCGTAPGAALGERALALAALTALERLLVVLPTPGASTVVSASLASRRAARRAGWAVELLSVTGVSALTSALSAGVAAAAAAVTVTDPSKPLVSDPFAAALGASAARISTLLAADETSLAAAAGWAAELARVNTQQGSCSDAACVLGVLAALTAGAATSDARMSAAKALLHTGAAALGAAWLGTTAPLCALAARDDATALACAAAILGTPPAVTPPRAAAPTPGSSQHAALFGVQGGERGGVAHNGFLSEARAIAEAVRRSLLPQASTADAPAFTAGSPLLDAPSVSPGIPPSTTARAWAALRLGLGAPAVSPLAAAAAACATRSIAALCAAGAPLAPADAPCAILDAAASAARDSRHSDAAVDLLCMLVARVDVPVEGALMATAAAAGAAAGAAALGALIAARGTSVVAAATSSARRDELDVVEAAAARLPPHVYEGSVEARATFFHRLATLPGIAQSVAIRAAAAGGFVRIVAELLCDAASPEDAVALACAQGPGGCNALMHACAADCVPAVAALLAAGADPHVRTRRGLTAQRAAVPNGAVRAAALLPPARADLTIFIKYLTGKTTVLFVEPSNTIEVRRLLGGQGGLEECGKVAFGNQLRDC